MHTGGRSALEGKRIVQWEPGRSYCVAKDGNAAIKNPSERVDVKEAVFN